MADIPAWMLPHVVTVTPQQQTGGSGWQPSGPAVTVPCRYDRGRMIREAGQAGEAVMSATTVYVRLSDRAAFPVNAKAVDEHGDIMRVLQITTASDGGMGGWEHVEVALG